MLKDCIYIKGTAMEKIGDLIPKNKITLLHGRSGSGKTMSILKYLISHGIEPIFIDFDSNDEYDEMEIVHIDGYEFMEHMVDKDKNKRMLQELKNECIVIDTYALLQSYLDDKKPEAQISKLLNIFTKHDITSIIVAHTIYYSGKPAEPDVPFIFANHVACRLHLHNEVKKTKTEVYLEVEKLRGMDSKIIQNWMRD